jgi:dUTP pyrophosphatase
LSEFTYYKIIPAALAPQYSTEEAACFDLCACLIPGTEITGYNQYNERARLHSRVDYHSSISLYSRERVLIPTGLVFSLPKGYSMRIHPRSGLSLKSGISLCNCEGVVDSDYTQETFVSLVNLSEIPFTIRHGDRVAQAEVVRDMRAQLVETPTMPQARGTRVGGFGSTGLITGEPTQ